MKHHIHIPLSLVSLTVLSQPLLAEVVASYDSNDESLALRLEPGDWSEHAEIPSILTAHGGLNRVGGGGTLLFSGWGPTIDMNKRIGFQISAKPGYRLNFSDLVDFNSGGGRQTANELSSFVWGYRIDENKDGIFEGNWVFGRTYTAADGDAFKESDSLKDWNFTDFSTRGTVEFAIFASAPTTGGHLLAFGGKMIINGLSATPLGVLDAYPYEASYTIPVSEASGVTYNRDTNTLFAIGDEGHELVELSKTGARLGAMPFNQSGPREARALDDPEGVSYLGGGKFAIADERRQLTVVVTYDPATTPDLALLSQTSYPFGTSNSNTGLEGVAYDPINQSLWGIRELGPVQIFEMLDFPDVRAGGPVVVREPILRKHITRPGITQLSDIYVMAESAWFSATDPRRQNILILSRDLRRLFEINRKGQIVGSLDLAFLNSGNIEGVTMDDEGKIYLVGEQSVLPPKLHVFGPGATSPHHTPEQVSARETYSDALHELGLVPDLALTSSSLMEAISGTRAQGRADVTGNPAAYDLFTESSIQDLRGTGVLIRVEENEVKLALPVQKTTAPGTAPWTDAGIELKATLPKIGDKEFYRLTLPE